jgi:hypothetical protein
MGANHNKYQKFPERSQAKYQHNPENKMAAIVFAFFMQLKFEWYKNKRIVSITSNCSPSLSQCNNNKNG